ncbi:dr1-associated corepressor homolog [Toxorhynchites rutilus septentrionalis]|uniref:dr1-associated corepressor homolog n=1 Tax=Toxorhynchites rutilus septentrionalis TaxID=329112 RepID=UPI00247A733A|nr:dr1-associated corepressor homolog [Toxorhynchites rutilus septentrionalis]
MPSKKKKYNARFPAGRIKKIMQTDEEVGKVAQAVPVIISRTLELFVESLLTKTLRITNARNAKTLSPSHMKQCIISESRFDFLRDLVKNIPDIGVNEDQLSGSEAGYGNETAASPASTSTSSSSNGGGTSHSGATFSTTSEPNSGGMQLQRSESYTSAGSSNYGGVLSTQIPNQPASHSQQHQSNSAKRAHNQANFYKEISLDESSSSNREVPRKLTRLHSAPAVSATSTSTGPIKINILPNLSPVGSSATQQQLQSNNNSSGPNSNNYKISFKIEPLTPAVVPPANIDQPTIKIDYTNLKLPMTIAAEQPKQSSNARHQSQPTIKIDLSSITNFSSKPQSSSSASSSPALTGGGVIVSKQVPSTPTAHTPSTPSTPLSALSNASSSGSSSKNPYIFQHSTVSAAQNASVLASSSLVATSGTAVAAVAPLYSSVSSSAIPDMDEDYDDI